MLLHEIDRRHCDVILWSHHPHLTPNSYLASGCYRSQTSLWLVKWKSVDRVTRSQTTLVTRVGNFLFLAFCPSPPLCNVDRTLWSNTSLHLTFVQHWKGEWGCWHLCNRYYGYEFMFLPVFVDFFRSEGVFSILNTRVNPPTGVPLQVNLKHLTGIIILCLTGLWHLECHREWLPVPWAEVWCLSW